MYKEFWVQVDPTNYKEVVAAVLVMNDVRGNQINITLIEDGVLYDLTQAIYATFTIKMPDGTPIVGSAEIVDPLKGRVRFEVPGQAVSVIGIYELTVEIYDGVGRMTAGMLMYEVKTELDATDGITEDSNYPVLQDLISKVSNAGTNETQRIENEDARVLAETDRVSAEEARVTAETDRATAETNRNTAETTRTTNETARVSAETSRETKIDNIKHVGEYNAATQYYLNNTVSYNGSSYMAIGDTLGNLPTDITYWKLLAQRGVDGEGSVSSVNSFAPDEDGNVDIDASDISVDGAAAGDATLTNSQEVAAKVVSNAENISTNASNISNTAASVADISKQLANYKGSTSGTDANGIDTSIEYLRADDSLYCKKTLSNPNANGQYQTDTWLFYDTDGVSVLQTITWSYGYKAEDTSPTAIPNSWSYMEV